MAKKISSSELKAFRKEALSAHNECRDIHGSSALKLTDELNDHAQRWAEQIARTGDFKSSDTPNYGENVAMHYSSASTQFSGQDVTSMWYREHSEYDYKNHGFTKKSGHFTQIVWKSSKEFGIGKAITSEGKVIIVANYKPAGNVQGRFPSNVFPPMAGKSWSQGDDNPRPGMVRRGSRSSTSSSSCSSDDEGKKKGIFRKKSKDKEKSGLRQKVSRAEQKEFMKEALKEHNEYRRHHDAPPLEASRELAKRARRWAKYLAKNDKFEHSTYHDVGENVAMNYSSITTEYSGKAAAEHWYSEIHKYDFKKPGYTKGAGHFTQMVWKGSREFGIGKAITKDGKVIIVGQYRPPGNVMDCFEPNVKPRDDGKLPPPPLEKERTRYVRKTATDEDPDVQVVSGGGSKPSSARRGSTSSSSSSSSSSDDERKTKKSASKKKKKSKDKDKDKSGGCPKVSRSEQKEFMKEALKEHNAYRRHHDGQPLEASRDLAKRARKWAKYLAKNDKFEHSTYSDVGENVAMNYSSISTEYSGKDAAERWYSEIHNYDFKKPGFTKGAGHFTQLVWKESREFGIGKAITKDGKVIIVGQYRPPGNVIDHFEENVRRRDDGKLPPPPQDKEVTRVVRTTEHEAGPSRQAKEAEINDTIKKMGGVKLKEADVSPSDLKSFQKTALDAVNKIRSKHGVSKLKSSDELDRRAQQFAAELAKKNEFRNSDEKDVGENVAMNYNSGSTEFKGQQVVDMWYKQIEKYDFKKPGFTSGAGHFTQMLWKNSKEFGLGKAITTEGKVISVAFFRPPGNVSTQFEDNVLPAKK